VLVTKLKAKIKKLKTKVLLVNNPIDRSELCLTNLIFVGSAEQEGETQQINK